MLRKNDEIRLENLCISVMTNNDVMKQRSVEMKDKKITKRTDGLGNDMEK
jgi:hypothetical protein